MDVNILIPEMEMMRQNHDAIIEALQTVGEPVNESTPMSELPLHIRHIGAKADCYLATIIRTGSKAGQRRFFTQEEWSLLSSSQQTGYAKIGILLVAEGHKLIIAKSYATKSDTDSGTTMQWASDYTGVEGLTCYGDNSFGVHNDFDSEGNTDKILRYAASGQTTKTFPAATRARAYKACTLANGGFDDDTVWSLPAMGHMDLIFNHRIAVNAAFTYFFAGGTISNSNHCTSNDYDGWFIAWYVSPSAASYYSKNNSYLVRPVAAIETL